MPKPTRCACGCYIADHLKCCPKCNAKADRSVEHDEAEEAEELRQLDEGVTVIVAKKLRWVLPVAGQGVHKMTYLALKKRFQSGEKNVKSAMLAAKVIALAPRRGAWSWEYPPPRFNEKGEVIITRSVIPKIFISPKGNKYVQASSREKPDLILDYGNRRGRLKKFARSSIARQITQAKEEQRAHKERRHAKKQRRKDKKKRIKHLTVA